MFTKQQFAAVAETIRVNGNVVGINESFDRGAKYAGSQIAAELAEMFETNNPRFNKSKFLQACGLTE